MLNLNKWKTVIGLKKIKKMRGVKIIISGRIKGIAKARVKNFNYGPLGTSTITRSVYYSSKPLYTKWGILGFKLFKS